MTSTVTIPSSLFQSKADKKGDEGERVGPLIYYGRYLFNKK
jgi:hypothetical protein